MARLNHAKKRRCLCRFPKAVVRNKLSQFMAQYATACMHESVRVRLPKLDGGEKTRAARGTRRVNARNSHRLKEHRELLSKVQTFSEELS